MKNLMRRPGLEDLGGSFAKFNTLRPDCKQWAADLIASRIPPGREKGIDGSRVRRVDGSIGRWVDGPKGGLLSVAPVREVLGEARGRFGGLAASLASPGGSLAVPGRSLASSGGVPGGPRGRVLGTVLGG